MRKRAMLLLAPALFVTGCNRSSDTRSQEPSAAPQASAAPVISTNTPRLAIVIDDFGIQWKPEIDELAAVPFPVTFAIMPGCPTTKRVLALAASSGREVLIHLPLNLENLELAPDRLPDAARRRIAKWMDTAAAQLPGAVGVNNHDSSVQMENAPLVQFVMDEIAKRKLFFIDSMTTPKSTAENAARRAKVPFYSRQIFIDVGSPQTVEESRANLRRAARIAKKHGKALCIGHYYIPETVQAIRELAPEFQRDGIRLVYASELVE